VVLSGLFFGRFVLPKPQSPSFLDRLTVENRRLKISPEVEDEDGDLVAGEPAECVKADYPRVGENND
jgi:hypothetical protein